MKEEIEKWVWIVGYEGMYQASNLERVKSLKFGKEKILKQSINKGYYQVILSKNGKQKLFRVHQLVAMAFLGHVPNGMNLVINHIDGNKLNNKLINLEIVTQRDNSSICFRKYRDTISSPLPGACWSKTNKKWFSRYQFKGKNYHLGQFDTDKEASDKWYEAYEADKNGTFEEYFEKLKNDNYKKILQYTIDGEFIREWKSATEVGKELRINQSNICQCCKGNYKSAGGFKWSYKEKEIDF